MKNSIKFIITFVSGVTVGAIGSWLFFKKKYERIAQEEIDSVKDTFYKRLKEELYDDFLSEDDGDEEVEADIEGGKDDYVELVEGLDYTVKSREGGENVKKKETNPYVVTPEEFSDNVDYPTASFTYYADGVVTDENDEVMSKEEIEMTIGAESLSHFGEYEDDSVFVRNDELGIDYEILKDNSNYRDKYPEEEDE